MVDTERVLAALQTLLADNATQDISPQDVRDFLISVHPEAFGLYNVKTFGAKGDGVTDDTADITAAASAASAADGNLYFPPGTYLSDARTWTDEDFHVIGAGQNKSILKANSGITTPLITIIGRGSDQGERPVYIRDMTFQGDGTSGATKQGLFIDDSSAVRVHRTTFKNFGGSCVKVDGSGGNSNWCRFTESQFAPGPGYRTNDVALVHFFGVVNSTYFLDNSFITNAALTPELGVSGALLIEQDPTKGGTSEAGMPSHVLVKNLVSQSLDLATNGCVINLIDTSEIIVVDQMHWDTVQQTADTAIVVKIQVINDTVPWGGNHIRGSLGARIDPSQFKYGVETGNNWGTIHVPLGEDNPAVHILSGAKGNDIQIRGMSGRNNSGTSFSGPQVLDDAGNDLNVWDDHIADNIFRLPVRTSEAGLTAAHQKVGVAFINSTKGAITYWDGADWVDLTGV